MKVGVFGDDRKATVAGELPDHCVIGAGEADLVYVVRLGKNLCERWYQPRRQVFVEQQFHTLAVSWWRSRSAAYSRHAWMSAAVR